MELETDGKKAFEILYKTEVGRKLVRLAKPDKITRQDQVDNYSLKMLLTKLQLDKVVA